MSISTKKNERTGKSSVSSTFVLGVALVILFVVLSLIIAQRVFQKQSTAITQIIEARAERKVPEIRAQFSSAIDNVEAFSGAVASGLNLPKERQEAAFRDLVRGVLSKIDFSSAWIVLEPSVMGKKTSFCYARNNGKIVEDEVVDINADWYRKALWTKDTWINDDIKEETVYGETLLMTSVYTRITDFSGKAVGVAGIDLVMNDFNKKLDGKSIFGYSRVSIVNSQGQIISTESRLVGMGEQSPYFEGHKELFERKNGAGAISFRENKRLVTLVPMSYDKSGKIWTIVVETPIKRVASSSVGLVVFIVVGFLIYLVIMVFGIGIIMHRVNKMRKKEKVLSEKLAEEAQNLVVASKENAATSQDQSAAVKEIVATMEDTNDLSKNISNKIEDVNSVAQNTTEDVKVGALSLNLNLDKLGEISDANQQTIEGIKNLGDEINNIWDIVTMITSVADQAKIIAFNAELEAASAGEAGKNFHIVATEVRRLADGIIDNTKEIKERISGIQRSSDALILASESGTAKVAEGVQAAKELEEKFASIRSAAEITANSARDISTIIQQQTAASSQILIALKQISAGVENFSMATSSISSSAENLKSITAKLNAAEKEGTRS